MILNIKRLAKFSSLFLIIFLFIFSFSNFAYADPTFTVNTTTVGQIDFIGSNVDGVSEVTINLTKKSDGTMQSSGSIGVVSGFFSYTFDSVTEGQDYDYSINGDGSVLKTGTVSLPNSPGSDTGGGTTTGTGGGTTTGTGGGTTTGTGGGTTTGTGGGTTTGTGGGTTTGNGGNDPSAQQILLENPLKNIDSIEKLVSIILNLVWKIGVWILAGFIIYTGFLFVAARGNPAKIKEAGEALKFTLIGGLILLGAWVIAEAIIGTVEALK